MLQGMCCAFIGPSLQDFQRQTNTTLTQISRLFVSHACSSMVGSVVSIYVVGGGTKWLSIVPASLVILAASVAVVPWCSSLPMLLALFSVQGLSIGLIATSQSDCLICICNSHKYLCIFSNNVAIFLLLACYVPNVAKKSI